MCYLIREQRAGAAQGGEAALPQNPDSLRPRWAGAVAATLIGGFAVAAMVAPPSAPPRAADSAAPAPIAASAVAVPTETTSRQSSSPVDDGVPAAPDTAKAGMGDCSHAL